jgi:parallel beta-helix repeat protein
MINYQGAVVDLNGVPVDGMMQLYFNMWDDSVLGNLLWNEVHASVQVRDGLFDVLLGSVSPIPRSVFDMDSVWLEVGQDYSIPMYPRHRIATVAYAFHSAYADTAGVALAGGPPQYALVYTVAQSGGNFTSVAAAIAAIPGGIGPYLIRVMPGVYMELGLSIPANVTLRGAGRDCCILDLSMISAAIAMSQPSATIEGFDIRAMSIDITAMDITLCDNDITNPLADGIQIRGVEVNAVVHDCRIHDCQGWGIVVRDAAQPFIHDNLIYDNGSGGVLFNEAGGSLSNNKILHNDFYGVQVVGIVTSVSGLIVDDNKIGHNFVGIRLQQGWPDSRVVSNDIFDNDDIGIEIIDGSPAIVANTITRSNTGIAIDNGGATWPAKIVGNNIWLNLQYGINCPAADGARGVISSNFIVQNTAMGQDINYVAGTTPLPTFNNNTFNTTVAPPSAPGLYNVNDQGIAVSP